MAARDQVLATVALMLAELEADELDFLPRLVAGGCSPLQALLLVLLVPLALGRAAIAGQPHMPAALPECAAIPAEERIYFVRLTAIPEYAAALEAVASGEISLDQAAAVGARGSELRAIQAAIEAGQDLTRSELSPPFLIGLADDPGFADWLEGFRTEDLAVEQGLAPPPPQKPWWRLW